MRKIYGEDINDIPCEMSNNNIEQEFIKRMCEYVSEALNISYLEKRNFESLLFNNLKNKIDNNSNDGLLQQYEKYILDTTSKKIIDELNLGDVKVNHEFATHAKFKDIVNKIKENYNNIKADYNE
jgi:spore maturation protein CgeB